MLRQLETNSSDSLLDGYTDHADKVLDTYSTAVKYAFVYWIVGIVLVLAFWGTVIFCCIRACKSVAKQPRVVEVHQSEQQAQIHYIVQQGAIGPDGNPIVYQQQPGHQYPQPIFYQQQPNAAMTTAHGIAQGNSLNRVV